MICCICSQIAGDATHDLIARTIASEMYIRRVVIETQHFAAFPSLGPLVPGHVILCPKTHARSFAALSSRYDVEFDEVVGKLRHMLRQLYEAPIHLFEHGMAGDGSRMLCSVDHGHLHFVPARVSIRAALEMYPRIVVGDGLAGLRDAVSSEEYVFYEDPDGVRYVIRSRDHQFESQFLRQVFAKELGRPSEWNWREHLNPEETLETYETLVAAFSR